MINHLLTRNILDKKYINRNKKIIIYNKKSIKVFLISALLVVIMIFCHKITNNYKFSKFTNVMNEILVNKGFLIKNIHITGNNILTKEEILNNFQDLRKRNILNIDLLQVYKSLLLNKWINDL